MYSKPQKLSNEKIKEFLTFNAFEVIKTINHDKGEKVETKKKKDNFEFLEILNALISAKENEKHFLHATTENLKILYSRRGQYVKIAIKGVNKNPDSFTETVIKILDNVFIDKIFSKA